MIFTVVQSSGFGLHLLEAAIAARIRYLMTKLSIYLVEDDALIAASLIHIIASLGHTVCGHAQTYDDAIEQLPAAGADLVILEIMLKGEKTGIDVANFINANLHLPFIIQSSISSFDIMQEARETGPCAILKKPVSKALLQTSLALITV